MSITEDFKKRLLSSLIASLRTKRDIPTINIIKSSTTQLSERRYLGDTRIHYTLTLFLKLREFNKLNDKEKKYHEEIIFNTYAILLNDDDNILEDVKIRASIEYQLDWQSLKGEENKASVLRKIQFEKQLLENVGTGISKIQECNDDFIEVHNRLETIFIDLLLEHPISFKSLWEWFDFYKENLETYASRRKYLNDIFAEIINVIETSDDNEGIAVNYEVTGWEIIDTSIKQLNYELINVNDRIDLNQIGLRCRETIIILANEVYNEDFHHPTSFPGELSPSDSARKIEGYIEFHFAGSSNEEKRKYAKFTNNLANNLTHKQTATLLDARLCLNATIALINLIKIIAEET